MKRYWLFAGQITYPNGGMNDFKGSFHTVPDAQRHPIPWAEWGHIFDTTEGLIVARFEEMEPWKAVHETVTEAPDA